MALFGSMRNEGGGHIQHEVVKRGLEVLIQRGDAPPMMVGDSEATYDVRFPLAAVALVAARHPSSNYMDQLPGVMSQTARDTGLVIRRFQEVFIDLVRPHIANTGH